MNVYGKNIRVEIFGESHGPSVGITIDGLPAGVKLDSAYIESYMARRRSDGVLGTARVETDAPEILSGVLNGVTTGAPLTCLIHNRAKNSCDYPEELTMPRPSHADYPAYVKFNGYNDVRGGGHFSGRLTAPLVFAGALIAQILESKNITIGAHIEQIGNVSEKAFNPVSITAEELKALKGKKIPVLYNASAEDMTKEIESASHDGDSVGGIIECAVIGIKAGEGSPFFGSVESRLSSIIFSVPGVKGIEFGAGFELSKMRGSEANDPYEYSEGDIITRSNNNGGILGGLTSGMPLLFRAVIKPTPSIFIEQDTINLKTGKEEKMTIQGRHEPCKMP